MTSPSAPSPSAIRQGFLAEHALLSKLVDAIAHACAPTLRESARRAWTQFRGRLLAHLDAEDALIALFGDERQLRVLAYEHGFLRHELRRLDVQATDGTLSVSSVRAFGDVLRAHARNDERMLYAILEGRLSAPAREATLQALDGRLSAAQLG